MGMKAASSGHKNEVFWGQLKLVGWKGGAAQRETGHKGSTALGGGLVGMCYQGDTDFLGTDLGKMCINDGWTQAAAETLGSALNEVEKCWRQQLTPRGRVEPARGRLRVTCWPSAAAPGPELMFSFGRCQVVQGAKEDEGRRPVRCLGPALCLPPGLRMGWVPLLGVISNDVVSV